jgi:hypothetical protein
VGIGASAEHENGHPRIDRRDRPRVADARLTGQRADHDGIGANAAQRGRRVRSVSDAGDDADSSRLEHLPKPASYERPVSH